MPDYRTHTLVAERGDVDFHKRPDPLRKNRRKWIWLAGCLGLWPLIWQLATRNDQTIYWANTVSDSHQIVQHDCRKCHREWFQTVRMDFMTPTEVRVIEAGTCQTCHWEDTRDHNARMVQSEAKGCFHCHAEHRHKSSLSEVADVFCVDCHRDLRIQSGDHIAASPSFITSIASFEDHPEFQIRRPIAGGIKNDPRESRHQAFRLATPPAGSKPDQGTSWEWKDKANFRFNHKKHLLAAGVGIPPTHPFNEERKRNGLEPVPTMMLNCSDCHDLDAKGEYFRPIHYETHCAACHELSFGEELSEAGLADASPAPLPHEKPEIIRGTLRDRLTVFINNHPERLKPDAEGPGQNSPLPFKANAPAKSDFQQKADWVEHQLKVLETVVQGIDGGAKYRKIQKGCVKCHVVESNAKTEGVNWDIVPPGIPDRWLPHSRFRHDRHDMMECYECHHVRPPDPLFSFREDPGSIFQSESAQDVLMPALANCRSCHGSPAGTPVPGRVKARDNCIECHTYHHTLDMTPLVREAWDRVDGVEEVSDRLWRKREVPISREQLLQNLPTE